MANDTDLLPARLAHELICLRDDCLKIQNVIGNFLPEMCRSGKLPDELQRLDYVTQMLDDLSRVLALLMAPRYSHLDQIIVDIVRLNDLKQRLLQSTTKNKIEKSSLGDSGDVILF